MSKLKKQSGTILPLLALVIVVAVVILALVVDNSRHANTAKDLQSATDAAALAGVTAFDSTETGWQLVKRAVVSSLSENLVFSAAEPFSKTLTLTGGLQDVVSVNPDTVHPGNEGMSGPWRLIVERGYYWWDAADSKFEFISLEMPDNLGDLSATGIAGIQGLPVWEIANAVRVTVRLENISATFAKQLGVSELGPVERTATASTNKELEYCVAPLAIPACSLLLDTRSNATGAYKLDGYDANMACPRELVFTEAKFEVHGRMEGITRSDLYPRPPYINNDPALTLNDKALPIRGVLGLPVTYHNSATESNRYATANELAGFFLAESKGCVKVRLGDRFRPVDTLVQPAPAPVTDTCGTAVPLPGFYNNPAVEAKIAGLINDTAGDQQPNAHAYFRDAFTFLPLPVAGVTNFPYNRSRRSVGFLPDDFRERRYNWPTEFGGYDYWPGSSTTYKGEILLADMDRNHEGKWTNPLCHSKLIDQANNFGSGTTGARVWRTKAAVIAPSDPTNNPYCDFASTFSGDAQYFDRPQSATDPVVVGFVELDVFDFNINDLTLAGSHHGSSPSTVYFNVVGGEIADRSPAGMRRIFSTDNGLSLASAMQPFVDNSRGGNTVECQNCLAVCSARVLDGGTCNPEVDCADPICPPRCETATIPPHQPYVDYLTCFDYFGVSDPAATSGSRTSVSVASALRKNNACKRDIGGGVMKSEDLCDVLFSPLSPPNPANPNPATTQGQVCDNDPPGFCSMRSDLTFLMQTIAGSGSLDVHVVEKLLEDLSGHPNYIRNAPGYDPNYYYPATCVLDPTTGERNVPPAVNAIIDILKERDIEKCRSYLSLLDLAWASAFMAVLDPYADTRVTGISTTITPAPEDREQYHCLPMHIPTEFPLFEAESWDDPKPRSPEYGCGGIRARIRCDDVKSGKRTFFNPEGNYLAEPMLVR